MNKNEIAEVVWKDETVELDKPSAAYGLSKSLKKVIVDSGLYTQVKGKNYVNVEGWQLAGMFTGIFPKVKSVEQVMTGTDEVKYRAEVSLFDYKSGKTVGYGVAFCSNKEYAKRGFDEYAVASMAQTRAVSKAYRLTLGWLMKLAGYEATPAEEMTGEEKSFQPVKPWQGSGKPTDKQLGLLAYLLKGLGKSQAEVDKVISQARHQTQEVVSSWIDDARRRTEGTSNKPTEPNVQDVVDEEWEAMSADEKLAAISRPSFKAAVAEAEAEKADSIVDMQREREAEASEQAISARIDREQEREAGGW